MDKENVKKKKRKRKYTKAIMKNKSKISFPMFVLALIGAIFIDTLNIIKNILITVLVICLVGAVGVGIFGYIKIKPYYDEYNTFADNAVNNCDYTTFKLEESTFIYDNAGELLTKLRGDQDSAYIDYNDIPADVVNAFVAVEDRTFWSNSGIDIKGLIRVGTDFIKTKGSEMHGASTITQQLARNIFLTHEVSLERKGKEMLIAMKLTKKFSKEDIMEFYVNDICYANAYYGIEAASQGYFNKNINNLSLSEIAYLCAIPNSPEYYNPYKYPERALERRDKILGDMLELGYISQSEYNKAILEDINIEKPEYTFNNYQSTYAIDCATKYIMKCDGFEFKYSFENNTDYSNYKKDYNEAYELANKDLVTGGYKIYTSLDSEKQVELQNILDNNLAFEEETDETTGIYKLQGAITVIDNSNGKVIAVIGGRSQETEDKTYSLNRAYQSNRQPGSSIKPLVVYTPALMNGYTPNTIVHNISISEAKQKGADVQSLTGEEMTLRSALERSKNGVAWQTFDKLGGKYCISFVEKMKFASICPDDYYDSASLGGLTYGVTTVEMASAYSTLENHGFYREPTCLVNMIDRDGNDIFREEAEEEIYSAKASDTVVDMMTGVLKVGTAAKLGWYNSTNTVAACKTGTTNESKDGWLCGFTPYYTVAVWVGYDMPKTLSNLYGATYPGNIWKESMLYLISDKEEVTEFYKSEEYYTEDEISEDYMDEDLLPGRADDELLSEGYYVSDYRNDRAIGAQLDPIIQGMYTKDKNSSSYPVLLQQLHSQGQAIIDQIYSQSYKAELQQKLDWTYNALLQEAGY